jgi:hypothetical protein
MGAHLHNENGGAQDADSGVVNNETSSEHPCPVIVESWGRKVRDHAKNQAERQRRETVRAGAVLQHVHEAMELLTTSPPPVVEAVRDRFEQMASERTDPRGELKRARVAITSIFDEARP